MAFESKTELKARVSANKLEADLLNNMIDSMVSLESDGSLVVDGDVQADSVTTAALTATTADIDGGTIDGATISGGTIDATAIDGGAIPSLVATTADINGGTIDGASIGASLASSIKATTIETTGNASIGVSPEPWGSDFQVVDIGDLLSVGTYPSQNYSFIASNLYNTAGTWYSRQAGEVRLELYYKLTGFTRVFTATATAPDQLVGGSLVTIYESDKYGNTATGGATLTGKTLNDPNLTYHFDGNVCEMKPKATTTTSGNLVGYNCYFSGAGGWLSIENLGGYCTFTHLTSVSYLIRQSTAIATSANQPLDMTTKITPS